MTKAISILYVEDNPGDARLLKEYLAQSHAQYRLHTAASLGEALEFLAGEPIVDIIVCDLGLPDSQGIDTFRNIHARARRTPILVLSVTAGDETALEAVREGAQDYLVKGRFDPESLDRTICYSIERDRAAKSLFESETRYRGVGELVPFGTWTASPDGAITYLSNIFLDMVGMTMDECKGYGWTERVHPEDVREMVSAWKQCVQEETPWEYQYRIRDRSGNYRTVLSRGTPVLSYRGEVLSWSGINLDVSERVSYVEALADSKQQLDTVVNTTHVLLAYMDPEFYFIWVNRAYAETDGKDPSYFPGKNHFDLFPYGENREIFAEVVRTGKPYYAYARAFEYADQPERGVSYWDWSVVPTKDGDGAVTGVLFSLSNVTERVRIQDSLRVSEEKYRLLVDSINSIIFVGQDGVFKFVNDHVTDILGYSSEELIGKEFAYLFNENDMVPPTHPQDGPVFDGTLGQPRLYRVRHKNGEVRHVEVNGTPMMWEGRPALLIFVTDVTDRAIAEEALRESELRYHSLFRNMLDGFAYHKMVFDEENRPIDYTFLEANDAFERLTGLKDVVGKLVTEVVPGLREENPEVIELYGRVALSGVPHHFESYVPALQRWFSVSVYSPQKGYFVTVFENITDRRDAEQELTRAHEDLKSALKASSAGTWDWDIPNDTFAWSDEFFEIFGMDPNTTAGLEAWLKAVHPEDRETAAKKIQDSIDRKEDLLNDYKIILPDGEIRWIRAIGKTFYADSTPMRMTGLCIDITDRKRAEETLRKTTLLSEGLNRINEVLHSSLDMGHIVRNIVSEGARMLGSETAALTLRLAEHWTVAYVHGLPDNLIGARISDKKERHAMLALESRRPVAIADAYKDERVDRRHMKKHGIRAVLVAPLIVRNEPFGAIYFNQHTAPREFTEAEVSFAEQLASTAAIALENSRLFDQRKRAEEFLQVSETRYRRLFEAAKDGILILNGDTGTIMDVNPYLLSMLGYSNEELLGKELWQIGLFKDIAANKEGFHQLQDKGYIRYEDLPLQTKDGRSIFVEFVSNVYLADHTKVVQCNIRDITDRKEADEKLRRNAVINAALAELYEPLTTPRATIENITRVVLERALELTGSAHGYVSEVDLLTADNLVHAITNMFPKQRKAQGEDRRISFPRGKDGRYGGLWGHALNTKEAFFTNHPEAHPAAKGVPKGHGRIERFLSVPVLLGGKLVGQIALANPEHDYSERDIEAVQRLAEFYALAIQRVRAEETIIASLAEKEALLREIHHRVKNNLQTVSSLLSMAQMGTKNREAAELLRDAESRVHAMALIHSQLYGSQRLDRIDVKRNIRELTNRLSSIYSTPSQGIVHSVEGDEVSLTIHQAIPAALAINEIVTNAFKYAFKGKHGGTIAVRVGREGGTLSITVADNGIGLPHGFDVESAETLGLRLVKNLIEGQLGGKVEFFSSGGTNVAISFGMESQAGI